MLVKEKATVDTKIEILKEVLNRAWEYIISSNKKTHGIKGTEDKVTSSGTDNINQGMFYTILSKSDLKEILSTDFFLEQLEGITTVSMGRNEEKIRIIASHQGEIEKEKFSHTLEIVIEL